MNTQHTPGPWTLNELIPGKNGVTLSSETRYITGTDKENITSVYGKGNAANAHLIAAAPELLASLKDILKRFQDTIGIGGKIEGDEEAIQRAQAVIGKATGSSLAQAA